MSVPVIDPTVVRFPTVEVEPVINREPVIVQFLTRLLTKEVTQEIDVSPLRVDGPTTVKSPPGVPNAIEPVILNDPDREIL